MSISIMPNHSALKRWHSISVIQNIIFHGFSINAFTRVLPITLIPYAFINLSRLYKNTILPRYFSAWVLLPYSSILHISNVRPAVPPLNIATTQILQTEIKNTKYRLHFVFFAMKKIVRNLFYRKKIVRTWLNLI